MDTDEEIFTIGLDIERLDAAASPGLKAQLSKDLDHSPRLVIVDFAKVGFVDSTGLGVIVSLLKMMPGDGKLAVAGLQPPVRRLFEITKLDQVFLICPTVEDARSALRE
jgi:anti-sigma B factor antagonist